MDEEFFTGDLDSLYKYWQDENRAEKFTGGGTRTEMVLKAAENFEKVLEGIWIDIGSGPGFVQSNVRGIETLRVVLDISLHGLRIHMDSRSQKVGGSFLNPPFRKRSAEVLSSFFCLSDYPDIKKILADLSKYVSKRGKFFLVDYASGDGYWERRKLMHGEGIVGNINLRSEHAFSDIPCLELCHYSVRNVEVDGTSLQKLVKGIPDRITRKFLMAQFHKYC